MTLLFLQGGIFSVLALHLILLHYFFLHTIAKTPPCLCSPGNCNLKLIIARNNAKIIVYAAMQIILWRYIMNFLKGFTKEEKSWMMYDWANSAYSVIIVTILPIIFVYPFIQKYYVQGVMIGAVKG